jgi:NAD(P)-dependent dehydrogenase (short-subunit alcohol dehydrogenase family)
MRYSGHTVLLTGAGGGIGRAFAIELAREGAKLVLTDLHLDAAQGTTNALQILNVETMTAAVDVTNHHDVEHVVAAAIERFKCIDALINLAGSQGPGASVWETSPVEWMQCVSVNLFGVFLMCAQVIPHMIRAGYGRIVNVASGAGVAPMQNFSAYAASKAGVIHFTRTLAQELEPHGITANAIGVRGITPMWKDVVNAESGGITTNNTRKMVESGFCPDPKENTPLALFLASEASAHVTGQYIEANMLPSCLISGKQKVREKQI